MRATGGLEDTVENCDLVNGTGTGFKFRNYTPGALQETLRAALLGFKSRNRWRRIMRNGMAQDFSWEKTVPEYEAVYRKATAIYNLRDVP